MKLWKVAFAVLGALCCAAAGAAETPKPFDLWLSADVTIDDRGHVTSLDWDDAEPGRQLVANRHHAEGAGVGIRAGDGRWPTEETRTVLSIKVRATGQDDGAMSLQITDAHTGPKTDDMGPPTYPPEGFKSGVSARVTVDLEVQQDGRAEILGMTFDSKSGTGHRNLFLKATRQAVATWKFRPEFVANRAVKTRMQVPVDYRLEEISLRKERETRKQIADLPVNMPIALDSPSRSRRIFARRRFRRRR